MMVMTPVDGGTVGIVRWIGSIEDYEGTPTTLRDSLTQASSPRQSLSHENTPPPPTILVGHLRSGEWVGVELPEAVGNTSGVYKGTRYFRCKKNFGVFVKTSHVTPHRLLASTPDEVALLDRADIYDDETSAS